VELARGPWYNLGFAVRLIIPTHEWIHGMAKPHRNLKKANHGARPANSKARKMKRKHIKT
jgi:hypothetical protein